MLIVYFVIIGSRHRAFRHLNKHLLLDHLLLLRSRVIRNAYCFT